MQTVELDCPPGGPRPGDFIANVMEGTGLTITEPVAKFFGMWVWEFDVPRERWERDIQPVIRPRIEALYHSGCIRHGGW